MILHANGTLEGGDFTFDYSGSWKVVSGRFRAKLAAKRGRPGRPGVLARDEVDLILHNDANDPELYVGFARQVPALRLVVTLTAIR